ncbi:MAG: hypothetical protein AB1648_16655 [Pseudomonadota bacterium]|jgi:hypothetical protein
MNGYPAGEDRTVLAGRMHLEKGIKNLAKPAQWWAYESIFMILALISIAGIMFLSGHPDA